LAKIILILDYEIAFAKKTSKDQNCMLRKTSRMFASNKRSIEV